MSDEKAASSTELRDRSWSIINRSVLDLPPRFISDMTSTGQPIDTTPVNGLIGTQKGFYRLAEDTRDGTRVLLHSYERDQLVGEKSRSGDITIKSKAHDDIHIYGIAARKDADGGLFRDDLNHDMRYLEGAFQKDLNLHVQEVEGRKGDKKRQIVKMANGRGGFGIFEGDKGEWKVRYYRNLRRGADPAERFTTIGDNSDGFFGRMFSMGREVKEFKTYPEALKYVRQEWAKMSMDIWRGRPAENESPDLRVKVMAKVMDFLDERKYRDWIVALAVGVAVGIATAFHGDAPLTSALFGGIGGSGWVVGGHAVENFLYEKWLKHAAVKDNKKMEHLKPYFEQNDIERYLKQTPENENRFRRKLDPKVLPYLRLLDHEDAGMNYDAGEFTPNINPQKPLEDLSSIAYRQFGAMFDSSQAERGLLAAIYPNGMVTLTQVNQKNHSTRHYVAYRKDFNEMAALDHPHVVETSLDKLPSTGPVHKVTHKQGRAFAYVGMAPEEFMSDLMHKVGPDAKSLRFFGLPLTDLFNVKGAEKLRPQTKDSLTIAEITEKKTVVVEQAAEPVVPTPAPADAPATPATTGAIGQHVTFKAPTVRVPGLGPK
ncbi:MAG TPA: hypothetical protein VL625_00640 [Patescibacteria group bacterium]|nr:hypothetical protein [Patescibacteria group bacterium]